ncbi:Probable magnesium transporter NIPA8 [Galdieria sulphuraria]|nr:Probable magnesium transporter NIPA8 [Galdieria sulphuraria]
MNAYYGTALIISGCFFVVLFGKHEARAYDVEDLILLFGKSPFVCYGFVIAFISVISSTTYTQIKQKVARRHGVAKFEPTLASLREGQFLAILYALSSAVWGTFSVVLAKGSSMLFAQVISSFPGPLTYYETYFIPLGLTAAALFWMNRLNHALKLFDVSYAFPMMQICWILFSLLAGGIYYEEFLQWNKRDIGFFGIGICLLFGGVVLICPAAKKDHRTLAQIFYENLQSPIIFPP